MDAATLEAVMVDPAVPRSLQPSRAVYERYVASFNAAMTAAGCTTVARAAMWCAQIGHESVGLKYMKELGTADYFARYNNRSDLGNGPADGPRYPGRGPLQVTGRLNYGRFSAWCYAQTDRFGTRLVGTPTWFVDHPVDLEDPRWGFLAATWYWTVERPALNSLADAGDVLGASVAINGRNRSTGLPNGWDDRKARYARALALGARLLPGSVEWVDVVSTLPVLREGDGYPPAPPAADPPPAQGGLALPGGWWVKDPPLPPGDPRGDPPPPTTPVVVVPEPPAPPTESVTPPKPSPWAWLIDLIARWLR